MTDHGQGRVHRFRDHVVAGVNWRPTRFVDEVPNSRVCSLCRMIPKWMLLLPCSHALCQSCHTASLEGGVGQCPLDQAQFEEAECFGYKLPTRIANTLKVHCWNEQHGCEYTGTMDRVLEHYENECTFHTVECLRCGEGVPHRDLPTHYAAGCSAGVSSTITQCPWSEPTALTLENVNADIKNLKAMLGDLIHDHLIPVMQSQLNELTEQVRSQETRFAAITREIGACERNLK
nr:TNF receptor-associated factor 3-like [Dermacentor andersoni]